MPIQLQVFDRRSKESKVEAASAVESLLQDKERFFWADFDDPTPDAFLAMCGRLGVDLAASVRFEGAEILPRLIERPHFIAFQIYEVNDPASHLDAAHALQELEVKRIVIALGENFVLTYHDGPAELVNTIRSGAERNFKLWGKTPGFVVFLLLERCLYDYAHINLANDNSLDRMEEAVLGGDVTRLAADVSIAGRNILKLKKLGASLQIVLMTLATKRSQFVSDEAREFYLEMHHNATAVRAAIDSSRDLLDGVVSNVQAGSAQRTAEVARLLTVVSAVFLPLTLISGIYGMNFKVMPELEVEWGYHAVLGVMAGVAIALMTAFKFSGWLPSNAGVLFRPPKAKHES